jgi:uncharacterized protein YgbK (DUF1537 family)
VYEGVPVVVNAASYGDLVTFVLGLLDAEALGKRFLYRTAASFVRVRAGLARAPLLTPDAIYHSGAGVPGRERSAHGLVVVGSYVPASTEQLGRLLGGTPPGPLEPIEVDVAAVLNRADLRLSQRVDHALRSGSLPVLFTSRELVSAAGEAGLAIGQKVTDALVAAVANLTVQPRFVVAKGGITSHEVARRGLGARRATALGQLLSGVPVWRLDTTDGLGAGIPYVVFPGNVGAADDLRRVVELLTNEPSAVARP